MKLGELYELLEVTERCCLECAELVERQRACLEGLRINDADTSAGEKLLMQLESTQGWALAARDSLRADIKARRASDLAVAEATAVPSVPAESR
jgi:hypothetical protein